MTTSDSGSLLLARGLERVFESGGQTVRALRGVDVAVYPGDRLALMGRSGSGKTTLLNILGGLDRPTSGSVLFQQHDLGSLSEAQLTRLRRTDMGFVFQSFGLIPLFSAYENVELALRIAGAHAGERDRRAKECLELVGLAHRMKHRPHEMSGGEQQRVAIARAIANRPRLVLADEPTGELDSVNAAAVFALLRDIALRDGAAVVVATHDPLVKDAGFTVRELVDGAFTDGWRLPPTPDAPSVAPAGRMLPGFRRR